MIDPVMKKMRSSGDGPAYSVWSVNDDSGMFVLRKMFPDAMANEENFVLFSTSGTHGSYLTIEDAENMLGGQYDAPPAITFLIIHPRLVCMKYGVCIPKCADDIQFLKDLRINSRAAMSCIGGRDGQYV